MENHDRLGTEMTHHIKDASMYILNANIYFSFNYLRDNHTSRQFTAVTYIFVSIFNKLYSNYSIFNKLSLEKFIKVAGENRTRD